MADSSLSPPRRQKQCSIGDLPEHILLHILSLLPTETAVATALLSRNWRDRWTLVPALNLHNSSHNPNFNTFVDEALDRNKSPFLRRFRLATLTPVNRSDLDSWISSAVDRNLQHLDLDLLRIRDAVGTNFVLWFFPKFSNSLVSMKLWSSYDYEQIYIGGHCDGDVYFPGLKVLHLKRVEFESPKISLSGFLSPSRLPLLEELVVHHTRFDHGKIDICFPALRRLEINFASSFDRRCTVKIECPALRSLALKDCISRGFHVGKPHYLVEANIDDGKIMDKLEEEDECYQEYFINLVHALSNVWVLKLSLHTMMASSDIPHFHNLVEVDFALDGSVLCMAMMMLHKFENLERLTFRLNLNPCSRGNKVEWAPPIHVPNCLSHRLATFCFREFKASKAEMDTAKYILENAVVLKNAKILFNNHGINRERRDHFERELSTSSRGSAGCQLEFPSVY